MPPDEEKHIKDILALAIKHDASKQRAVVVYDRDTSLSRRLEAAYRAALPSASFLEFAQAGAMGTKAAMEALSPGDFFGLIQSTHFRLDDFRIRIELFKRGLTTVEHTHLARMTPEQEDIYINALAYDRDYYVPLGHRLKSRVDVATSATVTCEGTRLDYASSFEPAKLNVGDYTGMANIGGTFPIGEVFTEPKDLSKVNGEAMVFAFAGLDHLVKVHPPFSIKVEAGILTRADDAPREFHDVLDMIRGKEELQVREFGLGMNRAMHKGSIVRDITAFERMKGLHFSLGQKHTAYKKPGIHTKSTRFHVDIFIDVKRIDLDGSAIYDNGDYS